GLDFAGALRSIVRQDPDVIMIGEMRDLETCRIAIQSALTGHLVLSTLHTNDAPSAVTRLLDLGVPHYLIQSTLTGVVAQRLVRTLCPYCKREAAQDPHEWNVLVHGWPLPVPEKVCAPVGCLECRNTGFM
ncbi:GspE/PulE family protein, partial [Staphylococcus aureus]|uniref:GspE/PulE family protein n=1 Tax=Staphylococcus aureus TaxID=1280 RepID=UPI0039BE82D2